MTTARINFARRFAESETLIVCVTIEGAPWVFTPAGVRPTSTAASSGTLDPAWWPGEGPLAYDLPAQSGVDPVRDLLDPKHTWEVYRQSDPVKGDVKAEPLTFDLIDRYQVLAGQESGEATELLSSRDARVGQLLTADVSATSTSIPIASTSGVPTSGIAYLGREALIYDGIGAGALRLIGAPAARGRFGSTARAHRFNSARPPLVTFGAGPRLLHGRAVRVWAARLDGSTLVDPTLLFLGAVGAGVQRTTQGTRWTIPCDPATEALGRKLPKASVLITGLHHRDRSVYTPFAIVDAPSGSAWLSADANSTDNGGFHANWSGFAEAFNARCSAEGVNARLALQTGRLVARIHVSTYSAAVVCAFERTSWVTVRDDSGSGTAIWTSTEAAPPVVAHMRGWLRLPSPGDIAQIPATVSYDYSDGVHGGTAWYSLSATCRSGTVVARIMERDATSSVPAVRVLPEAAPSAVDPQQYLLVTTEQSAPLGVVGYGNDPVAALRAAGLAIDALWGMTHGESIDWDGIAAAFALYPLALPSGRAYRLGDGDTLLDRLSHEARLRGMALCVRDGKVSVFRTAVFASTETTVADITEEDILCDGADDDGAGGEPIEPEVIDGDQPPATSVVFKLRDAVYQWTDTTAQADFADGATVTCDALAYAHPEELGSVDVINQLERVGEQLLGALAEPFRIVRVTLGPRFLGLADGDLVTLTHSRVPTLRGTLGVVSVTCQVQDTRISLWGGAARIVVSLRLQSDDLAGYAPAAWLSAITADAHAVCTLDASTAWGASGFALDGRAPSDGFAVGDVVVVSQCDTETPASDEQFTVLAVTDTSITLDGTPSSTLRTAAGSTYGCMLRFAPYADATPRQRAYLYVADHATDLLGGSDAPRRWAA